MKKNFFTNQKIITFYSQMEKHKIFQNKDFLQNTILKDTFFFRVGKNFQKKISKKHNICDNFLKFWK